MNTLTINDRQERIDIDLPEAHWFRQRRLPIHIHSKIYETVWSTVLPSGKTLEIASNQPDPALALRALRGAAQAALQDTLIANSKL
jgi:hypothetical protein